MRLSKAEPEANRRQAQNRRYEVLDGPGTMSLERGSTQESHDIVSQFTEEGSRSQDPTPSPSTGVESPHHHHHETEPREIVDTILFGEVSSV